jgi:predicted DNA-binding transcriptional regulator AlpA
LNADCAEAENSSALYVSPAARRRRRVFGEALVKFLRYPDLVARGVVRSRMTLHRLIKTQGFPPGVLISPNARAWDEAEIDLWVKNRPNSKKALTRDSA